MADIEKLEKELAEAKRKDLYDKWEAYLTKSKTYLKTLIGKSFIKWYANGRFMLFKVTGFKEQYYIDQQGFNGQFSPKRWLEITTSGYMHVSVRDDSGRYYATGIDVGLDYRFIVASKRGYDKNKLTIVPLNFVDGELSRSGYGEAEETYKFGFTEFNEYSTDPNYDNALYNFTSFGYEVPNEIFEEAKNLRLEMIQKTINFWEKHESTIKNAPKMLK